MWIKKIYNLFFLVLFSLNTNSQSHIVFQQDIFNGGITGGGYSPTWNTSLPGNVEIYIEPGSSIRKAYLFTGVHRGPGGKKPDNNILYINNIPVFLDTNSIIGNEFTFASSSFNITSVIATDITSVIQQIGISQNTLTITPPPLIGFVSVDGRFVEQYIYIEYENSNLNPVNSIVVINQLNTQSVQSYNLDDINTIDLSYNVGMALKSAHICDTTLDGSYVFVENNNIGLIGGPDQNVNHQCAGVMGHFYYQNNTFFGLSDDVPNNKMAGPDVIANIQPYLTDPDEINFSFEFQSPNLPGAFSQQTNPFFAFFFAYTSTCQPFQTTVTQDTSICIGDTIQLFATGGDTYSWFPTDGLDDPQSDAPLAYPDESTTYLVTITDTNGCDKVQSVRVRVSDPIEGVNFSFDPTICGDSTGALTVENVSGGTPPFSFDIGTGNQNESEFTELWEGDYILTITDSNWCVFQSSFKIEAENITSADFSITPQDGEAPLNTTINNQSIDATDYIWLIGNDSIIGEIDGFLFEDIGSFEITLIAYNNELHCADTAQSYITVYEPFEIEIPNVFTPNDDQDNDLFTVKVQGAQTLEVTIFNRWGTVLWNQTVKPGNIADPALWGGITHAGLKVPEGVYFYIIRAETDAGETVIKQGNISIIK